METKVAIERPFAPLFIVIAEGDSYYGLFFSKEEAVAFAEDFFAHGGICVIVPYEASSEGEIFSKP